MAGKITNRLHKALASCILARGFTREGMTEVASDLLGYAMQAAEDDFSGWESEGPQIHFYSNDTVKYLSNYADAEHQRAEALSELALTLTAVGRMKDAADVALRAEVLAGKQARVSPICKVIEALARAGLPEKAESLYVEAEGQLVKIEDVAPRALAWVDLAHARMLLDKADKARICLENSVNLLTSASYYTRSDIFQVVSASAPIIAQWEDGQVLWEMCRAILEVEKWWN
jgi:tetratricopeptide (TPR) repeat protein